MNRLPVLILGTRRLVAQIPRTAAQIPGPAAQIPLSGSPIDATLKSLSLPLIGGPQRFVSGSLDNGGRRIRIVSGNKPGLTIQHDNPALNALAIGMEDLLWQAFGEVVSVLQMGVDFTYFYFDALNPFSDSLPEEVVLCQEVFRARGEALVVCQVVCTHVVFKHFRMEGGGDN